MLSYRQIVFLVATAILSVVAMSIVWEFFLEEVVTGTAAVFEAEEDTGEKWKYVYTVTVFTILAMILPTFFLFKFRQTNIAAYQQVLLAKDESDQSRERLQLITNNLPVLIAYVDKSHRYQFSNRTYEDWFGVKVEAMIGRTVPEVIGEKYFQRGQAYIEKALMGERVTYEETAKDRSGVYRDFRGTLVPHVASDGQIVGYFSLIHDITDQKKLADEKSELEREIMNASQLQAIGQLASGIAHEVKTPTQYISDNLRFLNDSFEGLAKILDAHQKLATAVEEAETFSSQVADVHNVSEEYDLEYLRAETPNAISEAIDGVRQVTRIILAMKEFSHPGTKEKTEIDLGKAIMSAVTVSRNEWKYVADLETDVDPNLPMIPCYAGEINQVLLNLIVNAAQAIGDKVNGGVGKGRIKLSGSQTEGWAEVRVADTGSGIPESVRDKIFEPFFTTKEVGKGTGQGLAISYDIIVKKHDGEMYFETEIDEGSTFVIRLPLTEPDRPTSEHS